MEFRIEVSGTGGTNMIIDESTIREVLMADIGSFIPETMRKTLVDGIIQTMREVEEDKQLTYEEQIRNIIGDEPI